MNSWKYLKNDVSTDVKKKAKKKKGIHPLNLNK